MNHSKINIFALCLALSACAHLPSQGVGSKSGNLPETQTLPAYNSALPSISESENARANLPKQDLTEVMLYQFLLGDIATQRGMPELGAKAYSELAKTSRDPRVAKRAAQLAVEAHNYDQALVALKLWQELEPATPQATQMQLTLLLSGGRLEEATPLLRSLLKNEPGKVGLLFLQTHALLQRAQDKAAALSWLQNIAADYPKVAEAHWAVAQMAAVLDNTALANREVASAIHLRPEWDLPTVLQAQLWMPTAATQALTLLNNYLLNYPDNYDTRMFYARALLEQKEFLKSREQFQILLQANSANGEVAFAIALLSLQLGELDRAEQELQQALVKGHKDEDTVHYYLAQLHEARKDEAAATAHYHQVKKGDYVLAARIREAQLLFRAGQLEAARDALHQAPAQQTQQRVSLLLIEAQMLREANQDEAGFQVLSKGLEKFPRQPQLLFETAMAADKIGKLELFEQLLRKLIEVAPETSQAYNALGYSFLERNVRIAEGMKLVQKAYELMPGDAAIIDSVGWGHFRLGDFKQSVEFLQRAFALNPDPEIAAHLGEALWKNGSKQEALALLRRSLAEHPENKMLQKLLKQLAPE